MDTYIYLKLHANFYIVFPYNTYALSESNTRARHSHRFPWLRCSFISAWRHSPV